MTLLDKTLSALGLMRVAEHERIKLIDDIKWVEATNRATDEKRARERTEAELKRAEQSIARQAETILGLRAQLEAAEQVIEQLRPDAERWHNKLARDAERRRRKRGDA